MDDFRQALNTVKAELTPQPWEYTDPAGATLTVIPEGLPQDEGCAEVIVRITVDRTLAAELGVTTADMPGLLAALDAGTEWEHVTVLCDCLTVTPTGGGGLVLTVEQVLYGATAREGETTVAIRLPAGQRLPLASALRRATDVARGWEG